MQRYDQNCKRLRPDPKFGCCIQGKGLLTVLINKGVNVVNINVAAFSVRDLYQVKHLAEIYVYIHTCLTDVCSVNRRWVRVRACK